MNFITLHHFYRTTFLILVGSFDGLLIPFVKSENEKCVDRRVCTEPACIIPPRQEHKATIFFLHNIHNSGVSMKNWWQMVMPQHYQFEHIEMIFPNGVRTHYAPFTGMERLVWYDQQGIGPEYPELRNDTYEIAKNGLLLLIKEQIDQYNITVDKIIIGGFDQGGTMAMHMAFRNMKNLTGKNLAGCFAMWSYLCHDSILYEELPIVDNKVLAEPKFPPFLHVSADEDPVIKLDWAQNTFEQLKRRGVGGEFHIDVNWNCLYLLRKWFIEKLGTF